MDPNEEVVENLRNLFAPIAARLTPDIEPAFAYDWRETADASEHDDQE